MTDAEEARARKSNRMQAAVQRIILGSYPDGDEFFDGPQRSVVKSFERMLRTLIDAVFSGSENKSAYATLQERLTGLPECGMRNRFEELLKIDANVTQLIPEATLKARRWIFVDRFRRLASPRAYLAYEASLPAATDRDKIKLEGELRADLINLTNYVQQTYILNMERERSLSSIKWWMLTRAIALLMLISIVFIFSSSPPLFQFISWFTIGPSIHAFTLIFLVGMVGAITSISRKFQDLAKNYVLDGDPFNEIVALNASRPSVAISILSGGIFALLLYVIVVAGVSKNFDWGPGLLPSSSDSKQYEKVCAKSVDRPDEQLTVEPLTISIPYTGDTSAGAANSTNGNNAGVDESECPNGAQVEVRQLAVSDANVPKAISKLSQEGLGFSFSADIFRMLLLAFLAGFAERLVPDSIDRLIKREKAVRGET